MRAARNAPSRPSTPGATTRLAATAARSAKLSRTCRPDAEIRGAPVTPSAWLRIRDGDGEGGADQPAVHLGTHFLGDDMRIERVLDHGRTDEQDEFGSRPRTVLVQEGLRHARDLAEEGKARLRLVVGFADQAGQQYGLAAD